MISPAISNCPSIDLRSLDELWFQVAGTVCNLTCEHCFISCSPQNHSFEFLSFEDVEKALLESVQYGVREYYFTGGEPFMNPDMMQMLEVTLTRGFRALVLTNAMKPMRHHKAQLKKLKYWFNEKLVIRVSVDHYTQQLHERERGSGSWQLGSGSCRQVAGSCPEKI